MSFAILSTITLQASNTWAGGGSSTNWSDDGNWGGAQPTYGTITFNSGGVQGTTSVVDQNYSMNQLLWTGSSSWIVNNSGGFGISLYDDGGVQAKIENQSTGLVTLNAPITFAATTGAAWGEINAVNGDITFGSGGTISVTGSAVNELRFYGAGHTVTINSAISAGSRKLVVGPNTTDNNTVILNAANSYSGNTEVNVGIVQVGNNTALGTSIAYLGNGGSTYSSLNSSLLLNTSGLTVSNQIVTNKADTGAGLGTGTRTIGGNFTSGTSTYSGNIFLNGGAVLAAGNGGTVTFSGVIANGTDTGNVSRDILVNSTGGTVVLSGVNTYTGKTTITGGTVSIAADSGLGAAPGSVVADQLTLNGGTLKITAAAQTLNANRGITLGASGGTFDTSSLSTAGTTTLSGIIAGNGPLTLKSNGDLSATGGGASGLGIKLNATNTFTGDVTITSGLVSYASNASFGNSANKIILNGGGLLDANTNVALSRDIQVLSGGGTIRTWGSNNASWSSTVTGSGTINRTDGGTLSFTGNLSGYTGTYNNQGGTTKFITGANALTGTLTVSAGEVSIENTVTNTYSAINLNGGTLRIKSNNNALGGVTLAVGGNGTLASQSGSSALTLTNNATISGTNTLSVDAGFANITWNGNVSGTGTKLRISSSGTLTLGGTVNMGSTSVGNVGVESSGTMTLAATANVTAGTVYNSSTGILNLAGGTVSAGTISNSSTGALNLNGATVGASTINLSGNGSINLSSGTVTTTNVTTNNATGTLNISGGTLNAKYFSIGDASNTSGRIVQTGGTVNLLSGGNGFRLGHWNNGATAGSSYNLSGGILDATGLSSNAANSNEQLINIGWDGQGDMIVGGGAGSATLKAYGIQLDQNGNGGGSAPSTGNMTLTISNNGIVEVGARGIAQASALDTVILNGGTLRATANSTWAATMTANTSTTSTLDSNSGFTATASGVISGAGSLTKAGLGTVTLSGANTYTGVTTLGAGTLSVSTIGNGAVASGNLGSATNAATNLVFDGGTLQYTGATASTDRNFTINAGKTATFDVTANNLTVSGGSTSTTGALTKIGAGTLTLSGTNAHNGITTISAGTLKFANETSLYNNTSASWTAANLTVASGATIAFNVGGTGEFTNSDITTLLTNLKTVSSNGLLAGSSVGFDTTNTTGGTFTASDVISNSTGTGSGAVGIVKLGANILALNGASTYTGTTTVSAGTLKAGVASVANTSGAFGNNSAVVMANTSGATLDITGFNTQIGSLTGGGATGGNVTLGAATLTLGGDNTSPAAYAGIISGTGGLTKIGTGTQILSGANTYSGTTNITGGTLEVQNKGSGTESYVVGTSGTLLFGHNVSQGYNAAVTVNGSGASATTGLYLQLGRNINFQNSGGITLSTAATTVRTYGSGANAILSGFDSNGTHLTVNSAASGSAFVSTINLTGGSFGYIMNIASGANTATGDMTINGLLTGSTQFAKAGAGSLYLTGASTNTGNFDVRAGSVVLTGGTNRLGSGSSANLGNGSGSGKLVLDGISQTLTNLTASGTGTTNSVVGKSATLSTLTVNYSGTSQAFSGILGGAGTNENNLAFVKSGTGIYILSGANTFSGGTTISTGTLQVGNAGTSGTLGTGAVSNSAALVFNRTDSFTVANAISGSGTIAQQGSGTTILSGASSYTGATTITTGTLSVSASNNLGASAANLVFDGGTLQITGTGLTAFSTIGHTVSFNATKTVGIDINNVANTFTADQVLNQTTGGLTKTGAGILALSSANTYTGTTTVSAGTLKAGVASVANTSGAFGNNSAVVMANTAGAILDITGFNTQIGSITGGGTTGGNVTLGAATLTVGGDNTSPAAYAGVISGTGTVTKIGTGTQIFSGASTYSGLTTVSAGTLEMAAKSTDAAYTIASGATLKIGYSTGGGYANSNVKVTGDGVSATTGLYLKGGTSYNAQGKIELITGPTTVRQYGTGLAAIGMFDINFDGLTTTAAASGSVIDSNVQFISRGYGMAVNVAAGSATATGDLVINSGLNLTLAQSSNTLGFYKRGAGSIALNATANTANVSLRLEGGSVITGAVDAIGPSATVVTSSGTKLLMNGFNQAIGSLSGSGQIVNGSATATLLTVNQAAAQTFSGVIGGATANDNNLAITKAGSSTLTLSGNNTYTGNTDVTAGALNIQHANALGSTAGGTTVSSGAQLQIQGGITTAAESLSLSGTGISDTGSLRNISGNNSFTGAITLGSSTRINSDSGTLTLSGTLTNGSNDLTLGGGGNTTVSGAIGSGTGGLIKDGSGKLTLTGTSTYTGATLVSAGTMLVNGSLAGSSGTTVSSGATLGGTGSITNGVTVLSGGSLSPGASIESLGLGSLDLDGALLIEWDTTVSPNFDLLSIAGTFNLGSNSSVTFTNLGAGSLDLNTPYVFATYGSGGLTGTFNTVNNLPVGFTLDYNYGGLNQIAIVPEPSTVLISLVLSSIPLLRRKRTAD